MNASAKLYGICREIGYCVDDCGLCAKINEPSLVRPTKTKCEVCGRVKRANHNCRGVPGFGARRVARKLPKATPVTWDDVQIKICGWCRRKLGGHYAWCQDK